MCFNIKQPWYLTSEVVVTHEKMGKRRKYSSSSSSDSDSSSSSSSSSSNSGNRSKTRKRKSKKIKRSSKKRVSHIPISLPDKMLSSTNMIPEFNPLTDNIQTWIEVIDHQANLFNCPEHQIIHQALSRLQGTAKIWYESLIDNDIEWPKYGWSEWKVKLLDTFHSRRDTYSLFMEVANHKPEDGCSLYEFFLNT